LVFSLVPTQQFALTIVLREPISEPKTMMPAQAATQNVGRAATSRS
jgi:hypothetical protein